MFDENAFMNTTYSGGDTKYPLIPAGSDYIGVSQKWTWKEIEMRDQDTGQKRTVNILALHWKIDDARLEPIFSSRTAIVRQEFWLDQKPDGSLDLGPGKNVKLNQLRETLGLPENGWNPQMMLNQTARLDVAHRTDKESGDIFPFVRAVARIS